MFTVKETKREDVNKIVQGLHWFSNLWVEHMKLIAMESNISPEEFKEVRDSGIKFMEKFVVPLSTVYEIKLSEFKEPEKIKEEKPSKADDTLSEPDEENPLENIIGPLPLKKRGRPRLTEEEKQKRNEGKGAVVTPPNTSNSSSSSGEPGTRKFHNKNRGSFKKYSLTLAQRDRITHQWIQNNGKMNEFRCTELAKEMGFQSPNQVQGWVSYLVKVFNSQTTYEGRVNSWSYLISSSKISDFPVPEFFKDFGFKIPFTHKTAATV